MDEITQIKRENGRLKMQLELLKQKLYQVCLSHDHMAGKFRDLNVPMNSNDTAMMQATSRIMKATSTEEVETIYNEMSREMWKKKFQPKPKKSGFVEKVFFFSDLNDTENLNDSIMSALEKMIQDLDQQIKRIESEETQENPDSEDDLKPPF